jgi:hypothetical protein
VDNTSILSTSTAYRDISIGQKLQAPEVPRWWPSQEEEEEEEEEEVRGVDDGRIIGKRRFYS